MLVARDPSGDRSMAFTILRGTCCDKYSRVTNPFIGPGIVSEDSIDAWYCERADVPLTKAIDEGLSTQRELTESVS